MKLEFPLHRKGIGTACLKELELPGGGCIRSDTALASLSFPSYPGVTAATDFYPSFMSFSRDSADYPTDDVVSDSMTLAPLVMLQEYWSVLMVGLGFTLALLAFLYQRQQFLRRTTELEYGLKQSMNRSLGAQLTPHFLYNVLNTINGSIMKGNTDESMRIIGEFSKLMRVVFNNSRKNLVSVKEELEAVRSYIDLELSRLENGFEFEASCATGAENLMIPTLFIQPLVENSIWHGLSNIDYRGKVMLTVSLRDSLVEVRVKDNGKGFSEAAINKIVSNKASALGVLFERMTLLKALYGPSVSMKIHSDKKVSPHTEVIVTFPQINTPQ